MNSIQIRLLKAAVIFLWAVFIGGFAALSVSAQYGNLLSKAAADALAAGDPQLCRSEMKALTDDDKKNVAARLESARCIFVAAVGRAFVERRTKELIATGKSATDVKKEVEMLVQLALTDALNKINPAIAIDENSSPAYNLRGAVYKARGKIKEARADFDLAIALDSKNYRAYANRGKLKDEANDAAGAIADYEKAVAFGINDPFIRQRLPELKQKMSQAPSGATGGGTPANAKKVDDEIEIEFSGDKLARELGIVISDEEKDKNKKDAALILEGLLKPGNLETVNNALKNVNPTSPADEQMTQLLLRKQDISRKFNEFESAYAKPLSGRQRLEMLGGIIGKYQKALSETEAAEKSNSGFSPSQQKSINEYKIYYAKALGILNGMKARNQPSDSPENPAGERRTPTVEEINRAAAAMTPESLNAGTMLILRQTNLSVKLELQTMQTELQTASDPQRRRELLEGGKAACRKALTEARKYQPDGYLTEKNKQAIGGLIAGYTAIIQRLDSALAQTPQ